MEDSFLWVGKVVKTHGIKGQVRIYGGGPQTFAKGTVVILENMQGVRKTLTIDTSRPQRQLTILSFREVKKVKEAEALVGCSVYVAKENLEPLPADEFYWHQILDMEVRTESGISLGKVEGIFPTRSNDVFVVEKNGGEVLIPATDEIVVKVDLQEKVMIIRPLEGMLPENGL